MTGFLRFMENLENCNCLEYVFYQFASKIVDKIQIVFSNFI